MISKTSRNSFFANTVAVAVVTLGVIRPAAAHHSFAMYDQRLEKTLTGNLVRFIPGGNHATLVFELLGPDGQPVKDATGKVVIWSVEMGPSSAIARQGVTLERFPRGDVVTVTLNPLRNGRPAGAMSGLLINCGATFPNNGCTEETGEAFSLQ